MITNDTTSTLAYDELGFSQTHLFGAFEGVWVGVVEREVIVMIL